jgi:hypothetical protein
MTNAERELRLQLDQAFGDVLNSLRAVPAIEALAKSDADEAHRQISIGTSAWRRASAYTDALETMLDLSREGLLIVGSVRVTLEVVEICLASITVELDSRAA